MLVVGQKVVSRYVKQATNEENMGTQGNFGREQAPRRPSSRKIMVTVSGWNLRFVQSEQEIASFLLWRCNASVVVVRLISSSL